MTVAALRGASVRASMTLHYGLILFYIQISMRFDAGSAHAPNPIKSTVSRPAGRFILQDSDIGFTPRTFISERKQRGRGYPITTTTKN